MSGGSKGAVGCLVVLVAIAALAEGALRLAGFRGQPDRRGYQVPDPTLGWRKVPGGTGHFRTSEYDITIAFNSKGLRDDETTFERKDGVARVLALGDSFVLGYTVDRRDLFVDLLEARLNDGSAAPRWEVLNAGTEGYGTDQELLFLRDDGIRYRPDVVVVFPYHNDVFWNSREAYRDIPKPRFRLDGGRAVPANLPLPPLDRDLDAPPPLPRRLALGNFVAGMFEFRSLPRYRVESGPAAGREVPEEFAVLLAEAPPFVEECWTLTGALLREMATVCRENGAALLVFPVPDKSAVYPRNREGQEKSLGLPPGTLDPSIVDRRFAAICREAGIDCVDSLAAFRAAAEKGASLYYERDWHWSPEGNRLVSELLLPEVKARVKLLGEV